MFNSEPSSSACRAIAPAVDLASKNQLVRGTLGFARESLESVGKIGLAEAQKPISLLTPVFSPFLPWLR